jgi:hypothetical protein
MRSRRCVAVSRSGPQSSRMGADTGGGRIVRVHACFIFSRHDHTAPLTWGGQNMQPVHGAGDVSSNRWLTCSHPRVGYRLTIFDAGLPLSKNGYLSQRTPRVHISLAGISNAMYWQSVMPCSGVQRRSSGDIPNVPCQFSGDCSYHTGLGFFRAAQMTTPLTQTGLCLIPMWLAPLIAQVLSETSRRVGVAHEKRR